MKEYQVFPISNFRSGFNEAVEPWLLPRDAYQSVVNAHLYRGVLEKIEGYRLYANMTYRNLVVMTHVSGKTWTADLSAAPPVTSNFFGYGTIIAGTSAEKFAYFSESGNIITLKGTAGGTGTVNLTTNLATIVFNTNPPDGDALFAWDSAAPGNLAIMAIEQYYGNFSVQQVMVFNQRRVGIIIPLVGILAMNAGCINTVSEIPHAYYQSAVFTSDGSTMTYTGTLAGHPFLPGTVTFFQFNQAGEAINVVENGLFVPQNITDNGFGELIGPNVSSGAVDYATGVYSVTFSTVPANNNYFDATVGVYGDIFTGSISNFFTVTNYQFKAFFTNNVDLIRYYDGNLIQYLNTNLEVETITSSAGVPTDYDITACLHVTVNQQRLLLLSPTVDGIQQVAAIFWSAVGNPLDFTNDEQLYAPTSQPIRAFGFVNTDLIVRFAASERVFRYIGDAFSPFRWDSTNNVWDCDGPYSSINYDTWYSTVAKPGIIGSDGVNIKRVDEAIPDFTDPTRLSQQLPVPFMNQTSIQQCYGERFDDLKEGWLCYNSAPQGDPESMITASDNVLAFNYIDSTYAIYSFPLSCLGFGTIINALTWGTTFVDWKDMSDNWDTYSVQKNALVDLGGDQFDRVFELNQGNQQTNVAGDYIPVAIDVTTKNFNPFIEDGQLCRFGYLDLFVSAYNTTTLRVQFYVNDQLYVDSNGDPAGYWKEVVLTFNSTDAMSPNTNQTKVWKRIYVGAVAKEHTVRFYQNINLDFAVTDEQPVFIHAMNLYMKPAGRIFN